MVVPADVESGLACACTCTGCGAKLVAKKGAMLAWHFAHHVVIATQSCVESAIHAAAKQVVLEHNWLQVPEMVVTVTGTTKYGKTVSKSRMLAPSRTIRFDYSCEEVWEATSSLRPDVVGYRGTRRLLVEMCFQHEVDDRKREKLADLGSPALEIDLSDLPFDADFAAVRTRVLDNLEYKEWLVYPGEREARVHLRLEVRQEVDALNLAEEAREAAQQRQVEARNREKERVEQAVVQANGQYRALPLIEKERLLREKLGIKGRWPYYLNKPSPEASAIGETARLWQAALFARFIYGKASSESRLEVQTLVEWVIGRFGMVKNRGADAGKAVQRYLAYLCACGFLEKSSYNPYAPAYFKVMHGGLQPPPRTPEIPATPVVVRRIVTDPRQSNLASVAKQTHWLWRASWPAPHAMRDAAKILLGSSPYKDALAATVETLTRATCPSELIILANTLTDQGVPPERTLAFLAEMGLALRVLR